MTPITLTPSFASPLPVRLSHKQSYAHIVRQQVFCCRASDENQANKHVAQSVSLKDDTFRKLVSGEWAGYETSFHSVTGKPLPIPEIHVPDEFREWGIPVLGYDIRTSSRVDESRPALVIKRTRALPTVGCEADAIVPDVKEDVHPEENVFAFDDGTYIVCAKLLDESSQWSVGIRNDEQRIRLQLGRFDLGKGKATMFLEKWDAEWCNGEILPGCGGDIHSFAEEKSSKQNVTGSWDLSGVARALENGKWVSRSISLNETRDGTWNEQGTMLCLPRGTTVRLVKDDMPKTTSVEFALSPTSGVRTVLKCEYDPHNKLRRVSYHQEKRAVRQNIAEMEESKEGIYV